jgi:murein DD-endopeptidase MepM/ murein hydrolase activator NlpD
VGGCIPTEQWATAVAEGSIVRTGTGIAVLDLDGDQDEHTGWNIFYLHLETATIPPVGTHLKAGDPIGRPSCEGGTSTGTHVHIARKYNGEWISAGGPLAFNLNGWVAENGNQAYDGSLIRYTNIIRACTCSDKASQITANSLSEQIPAGQN